MSDRGGGSFILDKKPDRCCGGSLPVHESIQWLGIWSIIQTLIVFVQGLSMVAVEEWIGIYLIFFNFMYILNTIAYWKFFREDRFETRQFLMKTYKYIMIQSVVIYIGLFFILWNIPPEALPDKYEDSWGNEYEFPPDKKHDM